MFDLNPINNPNAWWQHVLMLVVAGLIGYVIGYRSRRSVVMELEDELAELDDQLDDCRQTATVAYQEASEEAVSAMVAEEPEPSALTEVSSVAPVSALPAEAPQHDNLKLLEGIGPKIEELLNKEGIITFRQLSEASNERLTDILRAAGSRFQMHDPESWHLQAEMAADGRWDDLKTWQDEMNKGRIS